MIFNNTVCAVNDSKQMNFMLTLTHTKHKQKRDVCINGNAWILHKHIKYFDIYCIYHKYTHDVLKYFRSMFY